MRHLSGSVKPRLTKFQRIVQTFIRFGMFNAAIVFISLAGTFISGLSRLHQGSNIFTDMLLVYFGILAGSKIFTALSLISMWLFVIWSVCKNEKAVSSSSKSHSDILIDIYFARFEHWARLTGQRFNDWYNRDIDLSHLAKSIKRTFSDL